LALSVETARARATLGEISDALERAFGRYGTKPEPVRGIYGKARRDGRWHPGQRLLIVVIDGRRRIVQVRRAGRNWELQTRGSTHKVQVLSPHVAELSHFMIEKEPPDLSRLLLAPMPGLLTRLDVAVGDKVEPGQPVAVMEAMKMENILRAPKAATVKATPAKAGDSLAVDQVIVEFE
jgi:propionyl-CoA carboxylase alpha chain